MGLVSGLSLTNDSDSESFLVLPRWMPARRILGGGRTRGVSFWPSLNSSGRWWLTSSMFLTRISCCKISHADGYYGAWPGWMVSVRVLPLSLRAATPRPNPDPRPAGDRPISHCTKPVSCTVLDRQRWCLPHSLASGSRGKSFLNVTKLQKSSFCPFFLFLGPELLSRWPLLLRSALLPGKYR